MTQTLRIFETFAGIGAQTKALKNIGADFSPVGISEWDMNAIISYAAIHYPQQMAEPHDMLNKEELDAIYKDKVFSFDGKKPAKNLSACGIEKYNLFHKANILTGNLGSITTLQPQDIPDFDLLTYSFPCQAISLQGKQTGLMKNSGTSSSLLWEIERILTGLKEEGRLPKYLLMENVSALFSQKFLPFYNEWVEFLVSIGYKTFSTIINAAEMGSPQARKRAFAVSILDDAAKFCFHSNQNMGQEKHIDDILDKQVNLELIFNHPSKDSVEFLPKEELKQKNSGIYLTNLKGYTTFSSENSVYRTFGHSPTLTASGAQSRIKIYDERLGQIRYLSPCESLKLMGFTEEDYNNAAKFSKDRAIQKQAGNSICVEALEFIFKKIIANHSGVN